MNITSFILLALFAQVLPPAPAPQDKAKAQELLSDGAAMYDKGNYTGALEKFNAAYTAYSSPKIWFDIGQANRDLGRPVEALEAFQKFLDGAPKASPEDRADAQSSVAELQKRLGQLTIACDMAGMQISIDGKPLGPAPIAKPIWAVPGWHQVTAIQKGVAPAVESVEVSAGLNTMVVLKTGSLAGLRAPVGATPTLASPPSVELATTLPTPEASQGWWLGHKWTWVAAGATVLLTGTAAIVGLSVNSRFDKLKNSCGSGSTMKSGCSDSDISLLRTRKTTANVLWGLAGAAAVTAGVLFYVEGRPVAVAPVAGETTGMVARVEF